ncbi:MAG: hypothetical protein IT307_19310 [Chloroflexi bacterium]|nr:hypothetical protein [Chloroflexota bacterium]
MRAALSAAAASAATLAAGCQAEGLAALVPPIPARAPSPTPALEQYHVTLAVSRDAGPEALPLRYTIETERFPAVRLELSWLPLGGASDVLAALLSERAEAAWMDLPNAARALSSGVGLTGLYQWYYRDPTSLFGLATGAPRSLERLRHARVGVTSLDSSAVVALDYALSTVGLTLKDILLAEVGADPVGALVAGTVVAVAASETLTAPLGARGLAVQQLPLAGWEAMPGPAILVPRIGTPRAERQARALVWALRRCRATLLTAPTGYLLRAEELTGRDSASASAIAGATLDLLREAGVNREPGWMEGTRYEAAEAVLRRVGRLSDQVELHETFVNDTLQQVARWDVDG